MLTLAHYHTIPLPRGWPRRVRSFGIVDELTGTDTHARCMAEHQLLRIPRRDKDPPSCRTAASRVRSHALRVVLGLLVTV